MTENTKQAKIIAHTTHVGRERGNIPEPNKNIVNLLILQSIIKLIGIKYKLRYQEVLVLLHLYNAHIVYGKALNIPQLLSHVGMSEGRYQSMKERVQRLRQLGLIELVGTAKDKRKSYLYAPSIGVIDYFNKIRV